MKKFSILFSLFAIFFINIAYTADNEEIKKSLSKLGIIPNDIQPSPIDGMKTILTNNGILYVTKDGKHVIQGPMYNISGIYPINITNKILMKNLNSMEKEMLIYKAEKEKYIITVFTDITCIYCYKLHKQIKEYNSLGITVRYLAFPRAGLHSQSAQDMKTIWCAKDRNKAFDDKINGKKIKPASCNIDITNHYNIGIQFGVTSTPAVVLSNGYIILGYKKSQEIKTFLDENF